MTSRSVGLCSAISKCPRRSREWGADHDALLASSKAGCLSRHSAHTLATRGRSCSAARVTCLNACWLDYPRQYPGGGRHQLELEAGAVGADVDIPIRMLPWPVCACPNGVPGQIARDLSFRVYGWHVIVGKCRPRSLARWARRTEIFPQDMAHYCPA